jgi:hypothetical protein
LEWITKKLFDKYSTEYRTAMVRMKISAKNKMKVPTSERSWKPEYNCLVVKYAKHKSEAIFPMSVVPRNQVGLSVKKVMI